MMRCLLFALACGVLAGLWLGPLRLSGLGAFSSHMVVHMGVVAIASPLLACSLARGRFDPVVRAPRAFPPIGASLLELIVVWTWHTPGAHHWARHSLLGGVLEQLLFLACGSWLWLAALGGAAAERPERSARGALAMLLTSMHMTLLGALLALPPRPLYSHAGHGSSGLAALSDQHMGGAIMLLVGGLVYLLGGLALGVELLRRSPLHPQRSS